MDEQQQPTATEPNRSTVDGAAAWLHQKRIEREAAESAQAPQEKPEASQAPDTDDAPQEAAQAEPDAGETEAAQEAPPTDDSTDATEAADTDEITLDAEQLAHVLKNEVLVDDDGNVVVPVKIDGKDGTATLPDLVKSYQLEGNLTRRSQELAEKSKTLDTHIESWKSRAEQDHQQLAALLTEAQQALNPFAGIDWQNLKAEQPEQYAALMVDKNEWEKRIGQITARAQAKYQEQAQTVNSQMTAKTRAELEAEVAKVQQYVPDWSDDRDVQLQKFVMDKWGVSKDRAVLRDAWMIAAVDMAEKFSRGQQSAAAKKSKPMPKVIKPAARQSQSSRNEDLLRKARERHRKEGSISSAVEMLKAARKQ